MNNIISAKNLVKTYQKPKKGTDQNLIRKIFFKEYETYTAVDNVSFDLAEGDMVGYLGVNGAGKSTTIKLLAGLLAPTSGEVKIWGEDPLKKRKLCAQKTAAVFGQKNQLWWDLPVWDSIELARYMYHLSERSFKENFSYLDRYLEISEIKNIPVRQLSLGQRMKANLCFSLLHNPKILFLDEPTIGLDLLIKQQVHDCIKKMNAEKGITMILTTHDVSDIQTLCKRTILIDKGKMIYDGLLEDLHLLCGAEETVAVEFAESENMKEIEKALLKLKIDYRYKDKNSMLITYPYKEFIRSSLFTELNNTFSVVKIGVEENNLTNILTKIYLNLEKGHRDE